MVSAASVCAIAEEASGNVAVLVEFGAHPIASGFKLFGRHAARVKGGLAVAEGFGEPPAGIAQSVFAAEALIKRGSGEGRERIKVGEIEIVFQGKVERLSEAVRRVEVVAENEGSIDHDAVIVKAADGLGISIDTPVCGFFHEAQVFRVQRFKSHGDGFAASGGERGQ